MKPPDYDRCQAEVPGNGPFTMGGEIGDPRNGYRVRCTNKPTVVATERVPGPDGLTGSMSLCDQCKEAMVRQLGIDFASFTPIPISEQFDTLDKQPLRQERMLMDKEDYYDIVKWRS